MKKQDHLPMCGVGPVYGAVILLLTGLGVGLTRVGKIPTVRYGLFRIPLAIVGPVLILLGIWMWYSAVFRAKVDDHIKGNTLAATGIYAWVRNPIYSAFLVACTGALLLANNLWLLILPTLLSGDERLCRLPSVWLQPEGAADADRGVSFLVPAAGLDLHGVVIEKLGNLLPCLFMNIAGIFPPWRGL